MSPASSRGHDRPKRAMAGLRSIRAFTMLELMIVVGIMALILMMGLPSIRGALHKEAFVEGLNNILDACRFGREQAILSDNVMEMRIYPQTRSIQVSAVPRDTTGDGSPSDAAPPPPEDAPPHKTPKTFSAEIPEQVTIDMIDINFAEFKDADVARIRFYPNGTSYRLTMIIRSDQGETRVINLEEVTALPHVAASLLE